MCSKKIPESFYGLLLLILVAVCVVPVHGQDGTVSISYRGAMQHYIGDSVIFDGKNTVGNTTVITVTGPGLPSAGVPPSTLTGTAGTGDPVYTDPSGTWTFLWDSSLAQGTENLNTGVYTFRAFDLSNPLINSSASISLRQPEFYATISPNPAVLNDYIQLVGTVQTSADAIEIDVLDASGNKVHTFNSPVSAGGYFQYGFHVDMQPGTYTIVFSSPSLTNNLKETLTVVASNADLTPLGTTNTSSAALPQTNMTGASGNPQVTPATSPNSGTLVVSSTPAGASVYLDSVLVGTSPVTLNSVASGTHLVEIKSPGYLTVSMDIVVSENKPTEISPEMMKAPFGLALSPLAAIGGCIGAALIFTLTKKRD